MFFLDFTPPAPKPEQPAVVQQVETNSSTDSTVELNKVPAVPLKTGIYRGTTASVFTPDTQKSLIAGDGLASQHFTPPGGVEVIPVNRTRYKSYTTPLIPLDLAGRMSTLSFNQKVPALPITESKSVDPKIWEVATYKWMFEGGTNSYLAKVIGGPEGTRTVNGGFTPEFVRHTDFGNNKTNRGSFSYQHKASSPEHADEEQLKRLAEQADEEQLKRLEKQLAILLRQAKELGVQPTDLWVLVALDLATQSPSSALGKKETKYASRGFAATTADLVILNPAINGNFSKQDLIEARVKTYINPETGNWTSTGLRKLDPNLEKATNKNQGQRVSLLITYSKAHGKEL